MSEPGTLLTRALEMVRQALALVDRAGAPADIGAYLDQALTRLQATVESTREQ